MCPSKASGRTGTKGFTRRIESQHWRMAHDPLPVNSRGYSRRQRSIFGTMVFTLSCGHVEERRSTSAAKWKSVVCSTCRKEAIEQHHPDCRCEVVPR